MHIGRLYLEDFKLYKPSPIGVTRGGRQFALQREVRSPSDDAQGLMNETWLKPRLAELKLDYRGLRQADRVRPHRQLMGLSQLMAARHRPRHWCMQTERSVCMGMFVEIKQQSVGALAMKLAGFPSAQVSAQIRCLATLLFHCSPPRTSSHCFHYVPHGSARSLTGTPTSRTWKHIRKCD